MSTTVPPPVSRMVQRLPRNRRPTLPQLAAFGAGIFCACLLGIATRQGDQLATLWPANALLLGWLLRRRRLAGWTGWSVAALAYLAADRVAGSSLEMSLHLTAANLVSAATGYLFLRRNRHFNRLLLGPDSALTLLLASLVAASASAVVAMPATLFLIDADPLHAFAFWACAELVGHVTVLPLVLLAYLPRQDDGLATPRSPGDRLRHATPLLALLALLALAHAIGGPGAPAFVVPALLWCALVYRPATAMTISLALTWWILQALAMGWMDLGTRVLDLDEVISVRLGVALTAIAPLLVAAMNASRERMLQALRHAAHHDALTGLPSRAGFFACTGEYLRHPDLDRGTCALMIDVDHFKQINDRHGHATGDQVLVEVGHRLRRALPGGALLGRLGGEEFAILLHGCDLAAATALAGTLCQEIQQTPFALQPGLPPLAVSVSIGVAQLGEEDSLHIDTLLHRADQALYRAKAAGRNRVAVQE